MIALHAAIMILLAFRFDGTGDEGDSIFHFLYSKHAFQHPENFLNHWAKPVFVLLTAGVAQFGFVAMKIFNILLLSATCWLTFLIGKKANIANAWLPVIVVMTAPMNVYLTLSGLTEPMFTFWLLVGIYGLMTVRAMSAVLWLSFLPFVRSEGLIVFCVVAIYLILTERKKLLPLLAGGHIVYALIGFPYYGDLLWVFNKMSYAVMTSSYGAGTLEHFAVRMPEVIGNFQTGLLIFGLLVGAIRLFCLFFKPKDFSFKKEELWLIYGMAAAYFTAHSLFWYLGIFNSFGLMRVMICIVPLIGIIIVQGLNFLMKNLPISDFYKKILIAATALGIIFFSLKKVDSEYHLGLKSIQKTQKRLAEKYGDQYEDYTFYFDAIYPAVVLDKNWFDAREHRVNRQFFTLEPIPAKAVAIWDSWFSPFERNIDYEDLANNPRFRLVGCFEEKGNRDAKIKKTCLFEFDSAFAEKKLLLDHDFEDPKYRSNTDTVHVRSGKYSKRLSSKKPAWGSRRMFMNAFENVPNPKLKISFWAFLPPGSEAAKNTAVVQCNFESRYKIFKQTEVPVFTENDPIGEWKYIELTETFPTRKDTEDRVQIYVINQGEKPILVDDMKVEWE